MRGKEWITSLIAAVVVGLLLQTLAVSTASAATTPIRLGAYTPNSPAEGSVMDEYSAMVGRSPDIVMFYKAFGAELMTEEQWQNLKTRGVTPMITWEPSQPTSGLPAANLSEIAAGRFDSYLRQSARLAKSYSTEVMIRFAHEMNISASLWGPGKDGNVGNTYVEAWRHVVSIFREEGATNVKWVWSPNVDWGGVPFSQYFPGESWVDYVALDGYNWGTVGTERWQSMSELFRSSYQTLTELSSKPVIFAETSCGEPGGSKAAWIREGFLHTIPEEFPRVAAVIWFNAVAEEDWRIDTSASALEAYREVVASSLYGGTVPLAEESTNVAESAPAPKLTTLEVTPSRPTATVESGTPAKVHYHLTRKAPVRLSLHQVKQGGHRIDAAVAISRPLRNGVVRLSRMLGGRRLRPGRYVVVAQVIGSQQGGSAPRRTKFQAVLRGQRGESIAMASRVG